MEEKNTSCEYDIIVLTLRLLAEDPNTFDLETQKVMARWTEKARTAIRKGYIAET